MIMRVSKPPVREMASDEELRKYLRITFGPRAVISLRNWGSLSGS